MDPRFFRLPNLLFTMVRVGKSQSKVDLKGPVVIPRELDPKLVAFRVPLNVNKIQIRNYLEELYKVDVEKVHTLIYLGKEKTNPKTGKVFKRPDYKKAYVRVSKPFPYPSMEEQRRWSGKGEDPE
jgi:ribosomal protein L23